MFNTKAILGSIFVIILLTTAAIIVFSGTQQLFGWRMMAITSGSMEPAIPTGSIVFVQSQDSYTKGDIVTFKNVADGSLITHRIVADNSEKTFSTKGDANTATDLNQITSSAIVGKVHKYLPWIGYFIGFVKTPLGAVLLVIIPGTILIYEELKSLHRHISQSIPAKAAQSAAVLILVTMALVPTSAAAYNGTATLKSLQFSTTQWYFPQLKLFQEDQELIIKLKDSQGIDTIEYQVKYKHKVDGQKITEQIEGSESKELDADSHTIEAIYIGTCSSEECTPHANVSKMKVTVVLKSGDTVVEELEKSFDWDN